MSLNSEGILSQQARTRQSGGAPAKESHLCTVTFVFNRQGEAGDVVDVESHMATVQAEKVPTRSTEFDRNRMLDLLSGEGWGATPTETWSYLITTDDSKAKWLRRYFTLLYEAKPCVIGCEIRTDFSKGGSFSEVMAKSGTERRLVPCADRHMSISK